MEWESDEFNDAQTAACGLLNQLIQSRVGPGRPPRHHFVAAITLQAG